MSFNEAVERGIIRPEASSFKNNETPANMSIFDPAEDVVPSGEGGPQAFTAPRGDAKRDTIPFDEAVTQRLIGPEQSPTSDFRFLSHDKKLIGVESMEEDDLPQTFLDRLQHFTWGWYTCTMSSGGLVILLSPDTQPHTFTGLEIIGDIVFIWDLCLFTLITSAILYRFIRFPGTFTRSLNRIGELLMIGPALVSVNTIATNIAIYGIPHCGHWLRVAWLVIFWVYIALSWLEITFVHPKAFSLKATHLDEITPVWMMPIFPILEAGPLGALGATSQGVDSAFAIMLCGLSGHGLSIIVCISLLSLVFHRLLEFGLPPPSVRPSLCIGGGPTSFAVTVFINLANDYSHVFTGYFGDDEMTALTLKIFGQMAALFVYPLGIFFATIAVLAILKDANKMSFSMGWWAMVFPNVGLTLATISVGKAFKSQGLMWIGSVLTCIVVAVYIFVFCAMIRAVYRRDILWPGKDEDKYIAKRRRKVIHLEYQ